VSLKLLKTEEILFKKQPMMINTTLI